MKGKALIGQSVRWMATDR